MSFVTIEEAKAYFEIKGTDSEARINTILPMACDVVEDYIGKKVLANTYVEYLPVANKMHVIQTPIQEVFEITIDDVTINNPDANGHRVVGSSMGFSSANGAVVSDIRSKYCRYSLKLPQATSNVVSDSTYNLEDSDFTVEMFVNMDTVTSGKVFELYKSANEYLKVEVEVSGGSTTVKATMQADGQSATTVTSSALTGFDARSWNHIAFTNDFEAKKGYLHVNGTRVANTTITAYPLDFDGKAIVGGFVGYVDEVVVTKTAKYGDANIVIPHRASPGTKVSLLMNFDNGEVQDVAQATSAFSYDKNIGSITLYSRAGNNAKITYRGGYDTVPPAIVQATLEYARLVYQNSLNKQSRSQGNQKVQVFGSSRPVLPKQVVAVLNQYKRAFY